ncbi:MAG TPA: hypothetical protein PLO37_00775 [Candidatus Hydrogenedentes bacterium]|nr:hypothetical protein [Candidatus Hydrogenedentota bacterium]HPG65347.1 hypothetical protein [Candidatus Hydrogenedentota bacterium]
MMMARFALAVLVAAAGSGLTVDENGFVTVDAESAAREQLCLERIREADAHYEARKGNLFQARQAAEQYEKILEETESIDPWVRVGIQFRIAELHRHFARPHRDAPPDSALYLEIDEAEYRQAIAWYEAIADEAEEAFPHKAARALLDMAGVYRTLGQIDQWAISTARARRVARHGVASDFVVGDQLEHLKERSFNSLLFYLKDITPEIRARIVEENPDDEAIVLALGPEPEPNAEASEPPQADALAETGVASEPPAPAVTPASDTPEQRSMAKSEVVRRNRTLMVATVAVVLAMVVVAFLVVVQGRARVKGTGK